MHPARLRNVTFLAVPAWEIGCSTTPSGATASSSVVAGDVGLQEVAKLVSTAEMRRVAAHQPGAEGDWQLSAVEVRKRTRGLRSKVIRM